MTADRFERLEHWLQNMRADSQTSSDSSEGLYDFSAAGTARLRNLRQYMRAMLDRRPLFLLVGEAPGYRGSRRTGVPFVSEALILDEQSPISKHFGREVFQTPLLDTCPSSEQTASVVWAELSRLQHLPLLWAAFPRHPHLEKNPTSNRTPLRAEVSAYGDSLRELIELFGIRKTVAVGNVASTLLSAQRISHSKIRHPAHGGVPKFREGVSELIGGRSP